ncbi:hypothetical protein CEE36_06310 [candidate division TA06 bacterium B3_TA06]|uniref:Outer-membrane lipoprotein carrier protein n=1 Tax=candidate division TA06 bacterium B3_TA06 TaxID=2012487 RepID=A0A532V6Q0_UNCT6|nr:MAG: hypothetical protein CEE36_06310 [candidate division TA06 bacterium B3_TA06]
MNALLSPSLSTLLRLARIKILIAGLLIMTGCHLFVRPTPELAFIEQAQGSYQYTDSTDTYKGRFLLFAHEDRLAVDLFAAYFHVASIRHNPDSTLVYLPMSNEVLILGPADDLPLEGWEIPVAPLAAAYKGMLPDEPDSITGFADTLFAWRGGVACLQPHDSSKLIGLRGKDWELWREGALETMPDRAQRIVFKRDDAALVLEFTDFKLIEQESPKAFVLNLPAGVERIDYR